MRNIMFILCYLLMFMAGNVSFAGGGGGVIGGIQASLLEASYDELVMELRNNSQAELDIVIPAKDVLVKANKKLIEMGQQTIKIKVGDLDNEEFVIKRTSANENSLLFLEDNKLVIELLGDS